MNVILLGPPGSGKGTLSRALKEQLGLIVFETGAALREYASTKDPALAAHLASGGMAPTDLVMRLLAEGTSRPSGAGYILDGIPRNLEQASIMADDLSSGRLNVEHMVVFEADEAMLLRRVMERSTCPKCGAIYNATSNPASSPGRCTPDCGGVLVTRPEDNPDGMRERLALYRDRTLPAIAILEALGVPTYRVDGSKKPAQIVADVLGHIQPQALVPSVTKTARKR